MIVIIYQDLKNLFFVNSVIYITNQIMINFSIHLLPKQTRKHIVL